MIDGTPFIALMRVLDNFAEKLIKSDKRIHELTFKRIGGDQSIDELAANQYGDSKLHAALGDEHHDVINRLVAVSEKLSVTSCKSVLTLYLSCILHSLKSLSVQLSPVSLISNVDRNNTMFSEFLD